MFNGGRKQRMRRRPKEEEESGFEGRNREVVSISQCFPEKHMN